MKESEGAAEGCLGRRKRIKVCRVLNRIPKKIRACYSVSLPETRKKEQKKNPNNLLM
jgi:hypothetical protein